MNQEKWRRLLYGDFSWKRLMSSVLFIYVMFCVIVYFGADRLMFHPQVSSHQQVKGGIMLATVDGERISALYRPLESSRYTVLYSHGNAEVLRDLDGVFAQLNGLGFSVFAYDYRGYGASEGKPTEQNTYEDINAAFEYLTTELGIPAARVIVYGRSIGGGPSTDLAAREQVAGLILESTFVTAFRVRTRVPLVPFDRFNNVSKIARVRSPVLVMHCLDDEIVPAWHGQSLFDKATSPKQSLWLEQGGHGGVPFAEPARYREALLSFARLLESVAS
jgi:fermentation-respiration switch protein FrsA (DUF1100 family)